MKIGDTNKWFNCQINSITEIKYTIYTRQYDMSTDTCAK